MAGEGSCARLQPGPLLPADHRQSSHHIHHPLSTHLPPDTRRRKTPQGPGRKPRRRPGASPTGETPTIEEGEEDEDEASEAEGARALTQPSPASTPSSVQVSWGGAPGGIFRVPGLASPAPVGSCSSSSSKRMKVLTGRQKGPVRLLPHRCPTRRRLPGPAKGPRPGKCPQIETSPTGVSDVMWGKEHEPREPQIGVQLPALPLWASTACPSLPMCKPRITEPFSQVLAGIKGWSELRLKCGLPWRGTGVHAKHSHLLPHL